MLLLDRPEACDGTVSECGLLRTCIDGCADILTLGDQMVLADGVVTNSNVWFQCKWVDLQNSSSRRLARSEQ